jgi:hypothetical protein
VLDYITAPQMAQRLASPDSGPLWIYAAGAHAADGAATTARCVKSVVPDDCGPGVWLITYSEGVPGCPLAVLTAGGRKWAIVAAVATIPRAEYDHKRGANQAGTVRELSASTAAAFRVAAPDWTGVHWHIVPGVHGAVLAPVNVAGPVASPTGT